MQFTNDEITLIKSAALNRYLQLGFTEKDAEVLYGNFISNINKSKPKKAGVDEDKPWAFGVPGLDEDKSWLSSLYDKLRTQDSRALRWGGEGALIGGAGGAVGGGLAGLILPNNDAGLLARLGRAARGLGLGALGGAAAGGVGGAAIGGGLDLNRVLAERAEAEDLLRKAQEARDRDRDVAAWSSQQLGRGG